jgi:hypothetical protein
LQRRWQDGCRIWPLLARGFGHTLDVVPVRGCTTACWTCQALIHIRAKLHSAYARHGPKEPTIAAQKASARTTRRWACRAPRWHPPGFPRPARASGPGLAAGRREPAGGYTATSAGPAGPAAGWSAAAAGCRHPAGARALLPFGFAADRDHRRDHVRDPDRGVHRAARFAPGVTFFGAARKPIA